MADSQPGVDASALKACGALLAAEAARFASFGWMRGTSGNLSMVLSREPLRLAVTASGLDKGELTEADIVAVDADGDLVPAAADGLPAVGRAAVGRAAVGRAASDARPSAEAAVHARIAAVTGAGAVMHVHTVAAVAAGQRWPSGVELEGLEMLKGIGLPAEGLAVRVPVVPNSQDMVYLSGCIEQSRDPQVPAVIVAGHGLYAWGKDIRQARHHTEVVGWLLELALVAR
jgi:methylthioribulose-1-phosphate dehydratase